MTYYDTFELRCGCRWTCRCAERRERERERRRYPKLEDAIAEGRVRAGRGLPDSAKRTLRYDADVDDGARLPACSPKKGTGTMTDLQTHVMPPAFLRGGKRTNLARSEWLGDWWVGYGKDEGCQFEGSWAAMAILAAKILSHPATEVVAANLYRPELDEALTDEQKNNYTEEPHVEWPDDPERRR